MSMAIQITHCSEPVRYDNPSLGYLTFIVDYLDNGEAKKTIDAYILLPLVVPWDLQCDYVPEFTTGDLRNQILRRIGIRALTARVRIRALNLI